MKIIDTAISFFKKSIREVERLDKVIDNFNCKNSQDDGIEKVVENYNPLSDKYILSIVYKDGEIKSFNNSELEKLFNAYKWFTTYRRPCYELEYGDGERFCSISLVREDIKYMIIKSVIKS